MGSVSSPEITGNYALINWVGLDGSPVAGLGSFTAYFEVIGG